jgi:hypothetical protein
MSIAQQNFATRIWFLCLLYLTSMFILLELRAFPVLMILEEEYYLIPHLLSLSKVQTCDLTHFQTFTIQAPLVLQSYRTADEWTVVAELFQNFNIKCCPTEKPKQLSVMTLYRQGVWDSIPGGGQDC